jgi:arsenate reductase
MRSKAFFMLTLAAEKIFGPYTGFCVLYRVLARASDKKEPGPFLQERGGIMQKRPSILFICVGTSARSQMAAGFLKALVGDFFEAYTVGIDSPEPGRQAVQVMREIGIDISRQKSKTVRESLMQHFSYVVSIAEKTRERSPIFPSTQNIFKWDARNPSVAPEGREPADVYRRVRDQIKASVQGLVRELVHDQEPVLRRTA